MSCYVKHTGFILINKFDEDMNIDCIADRIKITPKLIENLTKFNLGTQRFYDSVKTVDIRLFDGNKSQVDEDLGTLHKYFSNLECVNLYTSDRLSLAEICDVMKNWKLNHCSFWGTEGIYDYSMQSETGCLVLYDGEDHLNINFNNLHLK